MRVVIDIEANGLVNPTKIWVIVCKDIDTGELHVFRQPSEDARAAHDFKVFASGVETWIGHNLLGYDYPVLCDLLSFDVQDFWSKACDTLIISKMVDYSRKGHSIEDYGNEFGLNKGIPIDGELLPSKFFPIWFFTKYSKDLEDYCIRDVDINHRVYLKYLKFINNPNYKQSIELEHKFQLVTNQLHTNGFHFNKSKASKLLEQVEKDLSVLDKDILDAFPPKEVVVREFTPRLTKFGTISKISVPKTLHERIHEFEAGKVYPLTKEVSFNPASHKQIIDVLNDAGWVPVDKTKTHLETERELNALKRHRGGEPDVDTRLQDCYNGLIKLKKYGYKINENNLSTLPLSAPPAAKLLARRILLEARRRSLTEWIALVQDDGRIHGKFYALGAWTHRMAHQQPNTANIPNELDTFGNKKLLGKEMRSLWCAPRNRLLVGVDAEGIQLRIFAHYINDAEFTDALVKGRKENKSDPHSLNQRILGDVCKSRQAAKRFIYALLLGAGLGKLAEILGCSEAEAKEALNRLLERYTGFAYLKSEVIPKDARRGWFLGIDGRPVRIPGDTEGSRRHLAMSGYLQNGEAVVVKQTTIKTLDKLAKEDINCKLVNVVHDEVIFEIPNDVRLGEHVSDLFCKSIEEVGVELKLNCPLAGDGHVGLNWYEIH